MAKGGLTSNKAKEEFAEGIKTGDLFIIYDSETTGTAPVPTADNPIGDRMIQLSAKLAYYSEEKGEVAVIDEMNWYINPGFMISDFIINLTGITNEFLETQPKEAEVFPEIKDYFDDMMIIGYNNASFDDRFMSEMYKRQGEVFEPAKSLDAYKVAKVVIRPDEVENYKQPTIAAHYGFVPEVIHTADDDADALCHIINGLLKDIESGRNAAYDNLIKCHVEKVNCWTSSYNSRQRRLYLDTDKGSFFFDFTDDTWNIKDPDERIQRFNVEDIEHQAFALTGCSSYKELSAYHREHSKKRQ